MSGRQADASTSTAHEAPPLTRQTSGGVLSLKNRELSLNDLRELDYKDQKGSRNVEQTIEDYYVQEEQRRLSMQSGSLLRDLLDISPLLNDAAAAIVDDSFLRCFTSASSDPWNWNIYLFPIWLLGLVFRYGILFPLRFLLLIGGFIVFFIAFFTVHNVLPDSPRRSLLERGLVKFQCQIFVASWTGVVRYHGPRPLPRPNHVWVANHTSMIDYIVLTAYTPFASIMQLHPGWVGFLQTRVLGCLGCLWFNRNEVKDRKVVAERMKAHVQRPDVPPLLIFPEGTCVNNEYCVMFKRGAFDLGATVCPVAIKYNKIFVDAFWNSRRQSFSAHLLKLMTSWAVVCDVYFLEPQSLASGETSQAFAERVQKLIAERAKLKIAPWDGYLKYYNLGDKHPDLIEKRRQAYADMLRRHVKQTLGQQPQQPAGNGHATPKQESQPAKGGQATADGQAANGLRKRV
uniref:Glycerol-3-phosphate acyltransferase n=1 Tax=Lobosphaera incisa TaxID=312850 RepID=A0A0P0JRC6_9CHLO|nr:glycerol-3-phosphate acyltransferase [Lobosphaera incisa]UUT39807.1 glycerol-3-phosphate acyltransferase [Lobosphaera incisa]